MHSLASLSPPLQESLRTASFTLWTSLGIATKQPDGLVVIENNTPFAFLNRIVITRHHDQLTTRVQEHLWRFKKKGVRFSLFCLEDLCNPELTDLLQQEEMAFTASLTGMHASIATLAKKPSPPNLKIAPLSFEKECLLWQKILHEGSGFSPEAARFYKELHKKHALSCSPTFTTFLAYYNNEAVACASLNKRNTITEIYTVATLPQARGKGIGSTLLSHALQQTHLQGCTDAVLLATPMGFSMYKKLGFCEYNTVRVYFSTVCDNKQALGLEATKA